MQDNRRDVHASGGSTHLDDQTDSRSHQQSGIDGRHQLIVGEAGQKGNFAKQRKEGRVDDGAQNDGGSKSLAHHRCAQQKQDSIPDKNTDIDRQAKKVL